MTISLRLGRIRYINVLPIYYALEMGFPQNGLAVLSGTPAELNARLAAGEVDVSAVSSVEYARNFRQYYLVPDLSISTEGDVGSVLLFSRVPFHRLTGREVRLSEASATSAALTRILLYELYGARPCYRTAPVTTELPEGVYALLAIGDEALRLRASGRYPYFLDLGRAWHELTGLPFVFGVWAVRREIAHTAPEQVRELVRLLHHSKALGLAHLPDICRLAAARVELSPAELEGYFRRLNYDLGPRQQEGLYAFYRYLHRLGQLEEVPELRFVG
ncbi:MAG: menaquinone biosynthesis protein [Syntrophobacterales bacterium]|nr:menaquinone biosynthesis protein [Syntrophobacterales bacterium]